MIRFSVLGEPRPKGSMKAIPRPGGKGVWMKDSAGEGLRTWREKLASILEPIGRKLGDPIVEPVAVFCHFRLPAPKARKWPWPTAMNKGDLDKLIRTVLDHLTGVIVRDDSQVVLLVATKSYGQPGADVVIEELSALTDPDHRSQAYILLAATMLEALDPIDVLRGGEVNPSAGGGSGEGARAVLPQGSPSLDAEGVFVDGVARGKSEPTRTGGGS